MSFTSAIFLIIFFPIVFLLYCFLGKKCKTSFLCLVSAIFYLWCGIKFFLIMLILTTLAYFISKLIVIYKQHSSKILIGAIAFYVMVLVYYKYLFDLLQFVDRFTDNINLTSAIFYDGSPMLPLGISFYTFSLLSYLVDIYWQKTNIPQNIIYVYLYVLFFPKIIQGPIMRYTDFIVQVERDQITINDINDGVERFIKGFVKKVVIADQLQNLVQYGFADPNSIGTVSAWLCIMAYLLQLYYDFSGYSDMAVGIGQMLGFKLPENFKHPFISNSVAEFWRRWHITLGEWLRDYVYTPLLKYLFDKNYFNRWSQSIMMYDLSSLLVTWVVIGIWHGSGLKFLVYGLWWFGFISYERVRDSRRKKIKKRKKMSVKIATWDEKILDYTTTIIAVVFGMVLLRADSFSLAIDYWHKLIIWNTCDGIMFLSIIDNYIITIMLIGTIFVFPVYEKIKNKLINNGIINLFVYRVLLFIAFVIAFCFAVSQGYAAFLYEIY